MKVLHVNVSDSGSTGRIASSLHQRLLRDGKESLYLYARGTCGENRIQTVPERYGSALMTRLTGGAGGFGKVCTDRLIKRICAFRPDVVHLHNLHGYYVDIFTFLSYLKARGCKTVITLHDEFLFTGRCAFSKTCENWKTGCGNCPDLKEYPKAFFDQSKKLWEEKKRVFSDFPNLHIVTPSKWLCGRVGESFLATHKTVVIPNGIERDVFYPKKSMVRENLQIKEKHVVLAVSQDFSSPRKGGEYILALAKRMQDTRFLLVGADGKLANFPNVTVFPATQSREQMADLYCSADVLLMTSSADNFPTVCLEASACGTPVAGFDCGGVKETVPEQIAGFVPFGDVASLQEKVEALFLKNDREENATFFKNDAESMYQAYKSVYFG